MTPSFWAYAAPVLLLLGSNVFMTFAWYGHLKYRGVALPLVILVSWMLAAPEYMMAVPANRIGSAVYSPVQLKTIQEIITLTIFAIFSVFYLGEPLKWSTVAGFILIACGGVLIFFKR